MFYTTQCSRATPGRGLLNARERRSEDYHNNDRGRLILELKRLRVLCSRKHPNGSLFHGVAVLRKKEKVV